MHVLREEGLTKDGEKWFLALLIREKCAVLSRMTCSAGNIAAGVAAARVPR